MTDATRLAALEAVARERDAELATLRAENARLREFRQYAASVWFDEAVATDEERELMRVTRPEIAP